MLTHGKYSFKALVLPSKLNMSWLTLMINYRHQTFPDFQFEQRASLHPLLRSLLICLIEVTWIAMSLASEVFRLR